MIATVRPRSSVPIRLQTGQPAGFFRSAGGLGELGDGLADLEQLSLQLGGVFQFRA
jgi:hypothetical protein